MKKVLLLICALLLAACSSGTASAPSPTPTPCDPGSPGTRQVQVGQRSFLIHIPRDFQNPSPVVFTFHGRGSNAQQQLLLTGFEQVSEEGRFIVVAPEAVGGRWDILGGGEAEYLQSVFDKVPCADPSRVYASGMSMGSGFTFALACAPDRRFAAFGGVALTGFADSCDTAPPAPIIYFHGTKDPIVPFQGGQPQGEAITLQPVPKVMREWADHNGCATDTVDSLGKDVRLTEWSDCTDNADIDYYRVAGGGHTWPGAQEIIANAIEPTLGRTSQTVAASRLMWEFFQGYSLPAQPEAGTP